MNDGKVLQHITALIDEEHRLRGNDETPVEKATELKLVAEQLDQCWDLLRQRRAKREFGFDPGTAKVRDIETVERYKG